MPLFSRRDRPVTVLSTDVEALLRRVPRRESPDGTLERILAVHAGRTTATKGRLLRLPVRDVVRFALPASAAAAALVLAFVGAGAPGRALPAALPMVARNPALDAMNPVARVRVVDDPKMLKLDASPAWLTGEPEGP
jgi:hypothetical protein